MQNDGEAVKRSFGNWPFQQQFKLRRVKPMALTIEGPEFQICKTTRERCTAERLNLARLLAMERGGAKDCESERGNDDTCVAILFRVVQSPTYRAM